jgi:transcription elongation factor Elf1
MKLFTLSNDLSVKTGVTVNVEKEEVPYLDLSFLHGRTNVKLINSVEGQDEKIETTITDGVFIDEHNCYTDTLKETEPDESDVAWIYMPMTIAIPFSEITITTCPLINEQISVNHTHRNIHDGKNLYCDICDEKLKRMVKRGRKSIEYYYMHTTHGKAYRVKTNESIREELDRRVAENRSSDYMKRAIRYVNYTPHEIKRAVVDQLFIKKGESLDVFIGLNLGYFLDANFKGEEEFLLPINEEIDTVARITYTKDGVLTVERK